MNEMTVINNTGITSVNAAIDALKNEELQTRCISIVTCMNAAQKSLFTVAVNLKAIKDGKLYEKDGYKKFNEFCEDVLNYKHAMCNNLVRIADRFLEENERGIYSIITHDDSDYTVSQLQEVLKVDNDVVIEMDENGEISPEMTTKEIRAAVKARTTDETETDETETTENVSRETNSDSETENEFEHIVASVSNDLARLLEMSEITIDSKAVTKVTNFKKWLDSLVTE